MKPILFNTEMVRAILEDRKTMTRRVVNPQPPEGVRTLYPIKDGAVWRSEGINIWVEIKPPHQSGDTLYVREMWCEYNGCFHYKESEMYNDPAWLNDKKIKWRPSIHMPKEAARLFLRVTGVRAERLRKMVLADVLMEGIQEADSYEGTWDRWHNTWNSTIKPADLPRYGWEANPWVWVIEFERISREAAVRGGGDGV